MTSLETFDEEVGKGKKILEHLLLGRGPRRYRVREAFDSLIKTAKVSQIQFGLTKPSLDEFPEAIAILSRFSTAAEHAAYHEIGELTYIMPLLNHFDRPKNDNDNEVELSKISASDIYGDLLSSTLSPLNPEEQLSLLTKQRKPFGFSRAKRYAKMQKSVVNKYHTRKQRGYLEGPLLAEFYRNMIELQKGFSNYQRALFQLRLYECVQNRVIRPQIKGLDDIDIKEDFPRIIFNSDAIQTQLKDSLKSQPI